ncbi:hypothetical protein P9112_014598 [Eukaryota sp. TZLM1-RC]
MLTHTLKPMEELRFVVKDEPCTIKLEEGKAELFGTELAPRKPYTLKDRVASIFSFHGAKISFLGNTDTQYISTDTSMDQYISFHGELEDIRSRAKTDRDGRGPRVLITGPMDSGKSTLTQLLTSWAVRCDHSPIVVDLDVGQNHLSIPGTIAASVFNKPVDLESGLDADDALVFWYGHTSLQKNTSLFLHLVNQLAMTVDMRCDQDEHILESGIVVNTCGWVEDLGFDVLVDCIKVLEIDYVIVLGRDLLRVKLERHFQSEPVQVRGFSVSSGVVSRSRETRTSYRRSRIHRYFNGFSGELAPHLFQIPFNLMSVYKIESSKIDARLRPIGAEQKLEENMVKEVAIDEYESLLHSVLAISFAQIDQQIPDFPVAGFVVVQSVDMESQHMELLSPCSREALPSTKFVVGSLQWID